MNSRTLKARCVKSMHSLAAVLIGIVGVTAVLSMHLATASAQSPAQSTAEGDHSSHRTRSDDPVTTSPDGNNESEGNDDRGDEGPDDTIVSPPTTVPDSSTPVLFGVAAAAVLGGAATLAVRRARRQAVRQG
jgi:cytoskeletal protein RodZ